MLIKKRTDKTSLKNGTQCGVTRLNKRKGDFNMAKIDVTKIEGFDSMTPEQKVTALMGFEYEDHASELDHMKSAVSKANSEAAEWKRKHNALLSDDEKNKQANEEALKAMQEELETLRKDKTVSQYKANFIAQGYNDKLATETASAMADGDMAKVFANNKIFLDEYANGIKANLMKDTPHPPAGDPAATPLDDLQKQLTAAYESGDAVEISRLTRALSAEVNAEK